VKVESVHVCKSCFEYVSSDVLYCSRYNVSIYSRISKEPVDIDFLYGNWLEPVTSIKDVKVEPCGRVFYADGRVFFPDEGDAFYSEKEVTSYIFMGGKWIIFTGPEKKEEVLNEQSTCKVD